VLEVKEAADKGGDWSLGQFIERVDRPEEWTPAVDAQLIELANALGDTMNCSPMSLLYRDLSKEWQNKYPLLKSIDLQTLRARFCVIRAFNQHAREVLPFIDRQQAGLHIWNLGYQLCQPTLRRLILHDVKRTLFNKLLTTTTTHTVPAEDPYDDPPNLKTLVLNRHKASKAKDQIKEGSKQSSAVLKHTLLGQAHTQLGHISAVELRRAFVKFTDDGQQRTFKVKFAGEGVNDNGGPYRDCFNDWCTELQSGVLPF
jgi:hypothetical protein